MAKSLSAHCRCAKTRHSKALASINTQILFFSKETRSDGLFFWGEKKQTFLKGLLSPLVEIAVAQKPEIQKLGFNINTQIMFFFQKGRNFFWGKNNKF